MTSGNMEAFNNLVRPLLKYYKILNFVYHILQFLTIYTKSSYEFI